MDTAPSQSSSQALCFTSLTVPTALVRAVHAVMQTVIEEGQPAAEVADNLLLLAAIHSYQVPAPPSGPRDT